MTLPVPPTLTPPPTDAEPGLDVRVVLFTVAHGALLVAVHEEERALRLPRGVPHRGESLDGAARRLGRAATGIQEQYLEQLYTLSVAEGDESWTVVVSYLALVCSDEAPPRPRSVRWLRATALDQLGQTDRMVVEYAVVRLRAKLGYTTIAFHLMPATFTLTELQSAYEAILERPLDKRNFRRRMIGGEILTETHDKRRDGSHRPAALYRFRAEHDHGAYLTPAWAASAPDRSTTETNSTKGRDS